MTTPTEALKEWARAKVLSVNDITEFDRPELRERFFSKVEKSDGCWLWKGGTGRRGYGRFFLGSRMGSTVTTMAHRASFMLHNGPIPQHLVLDHICRVHLCVNPAHLRAVTPRENVLSGISQAAILAKWTECKHGHPFDEKNTGWRRPGQQGRRFCKRCKSITEKRRRTSDRAIDALLKDLKERTT